MAVPSTIVDLSTTAASNSPAGADTVASGTGPDDYLRALSAIVRREQAQATATASATTVDLGAITTGNYVHITGTTTITGFGTVAAGIERTVVFDGALTLTHSASLILPGGANITTAAGDCAVFRSEGSGNWRCVVYMPAAGYQAAGSYQPLDTQLTTLAAITAQQATDLASISTFIGTLMDDADAATARATLAAEPTLLAEYTVSGAAVTSIQFTGLDINTHKQYLIEFDWYNPTASVADASLFINNNTTATNYYTQVLNINNATLTGARNNTNSVGAMNTTKRGRYEIRLSLVSDGTNAYPALSSHGSYDSGSTQAQTIRTVSSITAVANITQIDLTSSIASSIGIGSVVRIYRGDK